MDHLDRPGHDAEEGVKVGKGDACFLSGLLGGKGDRSLDLRGREVPSGKTLFLAISGWGCYGNGDRDRFLSFQTKGNPSVSSGIITSNRIRAGASEPTLASPSSAFDADTTP